MTLNNNEIVSKNFSRQPYKGQGIYKTPGGITPALVPNYYQNNAYTMYDNVITVSGSVFASFLSPVTTTLNEIYFINRNAAGTHYPVQASLYRNPTPTVDSSTWTKIGQSGNVAMTTNGLKIITGINLPIVQGYQYSIGIHRASSGGSTTPQIIGRTAGYNNVFANLSGSDLANATPASYTTVVSTNTVAGLTAGTSVSASFWFYCGFI